MRTKQMETRDNQVYESLRAGILNNDFSPGEPLRQHELCLKLNVTRTPLRMALRRLEQDKLVVNDPNKGASVRKVKIEELGEIFDICEVLEGLAAKTVAGQHSQAGIGILRGIAEYCDEAMQAKQWSSFFVHDKEFHRELIVQSNSTRLSEIMEIYDFHLRTFSMYHHPLLFVIERLSIANQEFPLNHRILVDVLASGNATLAEETFRYHVCALKQIIMAAHYEFSS